MIVLAGRWNLDSHCEIVFYSWRHRGHELEQTLAILKPPLLTPDVVDQGRGDPTFRNTTKY